MAVFKWNEQRILAAQLLAEGNLTDEAIATELGVVRATLSNWKQTPEFAGRIQELVDEFRQKVRLRGLAIIENRVDALNDRWLRLKRVVAERATSPEMQGVPGGATGLIVRQVKAVKVWEARNEGDDLTHCTPTRESRMVEEYAIDTGLLSELRHHEKQAASELGQDDKPDSLNLQDIVAFVLRHVPVEVHQVFLDGLSRELAAQTR